MGRGLALVALALVGLSLVGCGNFFVPQTTNTTTTTGSGSGDYVYVVNQTTDTLSGFTVASAALTAVTGSPYGLLTGLAPTSVAVSRNDEFVYVGGVGAIELFSIGTGGVLTLVNSSAVSASARFVSLDTSPDGQWVFGLDGLTQTVFVFAANSSTGALTLSTQLPYSAASGVGAVVPTQIHISPNGAYVIATLGTGGDALFTFNTSTGALAQALSLGVGSGYTDNAAVFDSASAYLYIARGGPMSGASGVTSFSVTNINGITLTGVQTTLAPSGNAPFSMLLDATGSYLYTANRADGTVSGFTISAGNLTPITGSPFAGGSEATALVEDNTDKLVLAAAFGGAPDVTSYSFDTTVGGKLDKAATAASGTDPAGSFAIAATH